MSATTYHSFKSLIEFYSGGIEIPILQRDYAQGRLNRESIRNEFLANLIDCLNKQSTDDNSILVLDFVYGYSEFDKEIGRFIPLDGQQRLTTLFLLHFYCLQETEENFFANRQVLSYNTRLTSQKFCSELVQKGSKLKRNGKFTAQIKDSSWFSNSWLKDPTVKGMLVMLDDIDKRLHQKELTHYWKRLTKDQCVKFLIKDINDKSNYIASDNLYIKMNARGKPLSEFENFKSFIDALVQKDCPEIYDEWISNIDHLWTDLFWEHRNTTDKNPEEIGDEFMRFFKSMLYDKLLIIGEKSFVDRLPEDFDDSLVSFFSLNIKEDKKKNGAKIYNDLVKQLSNDELIPNLIYKTLSLFDAELLTRIKNILNYLAERLKSIIVKIDPLSFNISSQQSDNKDPFKRNIFQGVITGRITFQNRLLFLALSEILLKGDSLDEAYEKLRIIRNLIENRAYNNVTEYADGINEIKKIVSFDNVLVSFADESTKIEHFVKEQINEERNKAKILLSANGKMWSESINRAENNDYLLGQISYLFRFSEIEDYNMPNDRNLELFNKYCLVSEKVFDYNKINIQTNYLQRALLCFGDYLISFGGKRYSFLNTNKDRDTTFKRLLLNADKSIYFRQLLDSVDLALDFEEQLKKIISKVGSLSVNSWSKQIITNGYILKNIGNYKLLEFHGDSNQIVHLITGNNNGWKYAELNTFDFYLKTLNNKNDLKIDEKRWKLDYYFSSSDDKSCMVLNEINNNKKIAIDIHFEDYKVIGCKYRISLFCRNVYNNDRRQVLEEYFKEKITDFSWVENDYYRFERFYDNITDCQTDIQHLIV